MKLNRTVQMSAATFLPALATLLFVQACGVSGSARSDETADPLEGVWEAVVTLRDCTTQAATGQFRGAQTAHRGGTVTDTGAGAPGSRGPGLGHWSRNADGTYAIRFRFYRFNADGTLAGTSVVTSIRTLGAGGTTYTAVGRNELRDPAGNVTATLCVTDEATRFN